MVRYGEIRRDQAGKGAKGRECAVAKRQAEFHMGEKAGEALREGQLGSLTLSHSNAAL
jgi:hypothetical protein